MAAKDLIPATRAMDSLGGPQGSANLTLSGNETQTLTDLITSVSDAIEKYCKRRFLTHFFDELYNGSGDKRLLLRQYPLQSVQSVRYMPVFVCQVGNFNTTLNQQARVSVTSTGLQCWRSASGTAYTETLLTWSAYPTLSSLMNAVTALGNGWQGQVVSSATSQFAGDYGNWPSADLYVPNSYGDPLEGSGVQTSQGNLNARGNWAALLMHTYELQGYQWDARGWLLRAIPYTDPELLHPEDLIWPVGVNNFRIQYTAGYTTVPEAVQEACAEWVAELFWLTKRDPALLHQVPSSGTASGWGPLGTPRAQPPQSVRALLAPYKRITVATNQS
ncbi:MAG TPA: hypothetical protein VMF69_08220 [Gemmataceae bacterium]|nr:hypothetical protein [Gemmataceae bacterium]